MTEEQINDQIYEDLREWCEEVGVKITDIMVDENGNYYVLSQSDNGNPTEDGYSINTTKIILPTKFQHLTL